MTPEVREDRSQVSSGTEKNGERNDCGPIREANRWAAIDGTRVSLRWTKEESEEIAVIKYTE